jgi:hypothetical protein
MNKDFDIFEDINDDNLEEFDKREKALRKKEIIVNLVITFFMLLIGIIVLIICIKVYNTAHDFGSSLWKDFYIEHNLEEP